MKLTTIILSNFDKPTWRHILGMLQIWFQATNKANIAVKGVKLMFWFPGAYKIDYYTVVY